MFLATILKSGQMVQKWDFAVRAAKYMGLLRAWKENWTLSLPLPSPGTMLNFRCSSRLGLQPANKLLAVLLCCCLWISSWNLYARLYLQRKEETTLLCL